jgi:hypothetical protein
MGPPFKQVLASNRRPENSAYFEEALIGGAALSALQAELASSAWAFMIRNQYSGGGEFLRHRRQQFGPLAGSRSKNKAIFFIWLNILKKQGYGIFAKTQSWAGLERFLEVIRFSQ